MEGNTAVRQYDIVMAVSGPAGLEDSVAALMAVELPQEQLRLILCPLKGGQLPPNWRELCAGLGEAILLEGSAATLGAALCRGSQAGDAPMVVFLEQGAIVPPCFFRVLEQAARQEGQTAAFEPRLLPVESGHPMDPVTMELAQADCRVLAVRRAVLEAAGGPDPRLDGPCVGRDLSLRLRAQGWKLRYLPQLGVTLTKGEAAGLESLEDYAASLYDPLLLWAKYGSLGGLYRAKAQYLAQLRHPRHFPGVRRVLAQSYLRSLGACWALFLWRFSHGEQARRCRPLFLEPVLPDRGRCPCPALGREGPLISVILRTCGRPQTLARTLESLRHQTYGNFELLVAEDGPPQAQPMLEEQFSDLPIRYLNDGVRHGRAANGNRALEAARGQLCCFLDDDDFFYPDHLELLAGVLTAHPEADLVLGSSMALFLREDGTPQELRPMVFDRIDRFNMCQECRIPIQSALFRRSLFQQWGGLIEGLDAHEDWGMWLKYLEHGRRIHADGPDVRRITSVFTQPAGLQQAQARMLEYSRSDQAFYGNSQLRFDVTLADMRRYYDGMIADLRCLEEKGLLHQFLEEQARR